MVEGFGSVVRRAAAAIVFGSLALGLAPDPVLTVTAWAEEARYVAPESSPRPGRWSTALVPYLREVMDCLSPCMEEVREVTFKKSAQVAGTEAGINLIGMIATRAPAPMLVVLPTVDEAKKYNDVKLQPAIDASPELRARVRDQRSRSERGSTTLHKKFPGGYCQITGANSSKGLQMIAVKIIIKEELSEWPFDVDGRGDPDALADKRATAFSKDCKKFNCSTPGIKGMCRISAKYEASDQRRYYVPCPHCGHEQVLKWEGLRYAETWPHRAVYACEANGCVIEHHHKPAMLAAGRWIAGQPGEGRQPGFAINQLYSPFVDWDDTVAEWMKAKGDPIKEKVFTQQVLGEPWEAKGEAPDYLKLFARREDYPLGRLPPGAMIVTAGVDVQADRLEFAVWAWGLGKTSWLVDRGVIPGDTAGLETWAKLGPVLARQYEDWQGRLWPIEAAAIDSGYNTHTVYEWVRHQGDRVFAVKGMPGHLAPALGTPSRQEVDWQGKRVRGGILLWPVGTWTLKSATYAGLRKTIEGPGSDGTFPAGYVHLPMALDEAYLQQLTAEYLVAHERGGLQVQEWVKPRDARNEALDCRVYAAAAAVHLGIDRLSPADWLTLAAERGAPPAPLQGDLAALWAPDLAAAAEAPPAPPPAAAEANGVRPAGGGDWLGGRGRGWL
jgi:phage terminase large subunit GpA-like protein